MKISHDEFDVLRQSVRRYRRLFLFSSFLCFLALTGFVYPILKNNLPEFIRMAAQPPPYSKEVSEILNRLSYSATGMFTRPEVSITLDFDKKEWTLHNIHRFDENGNLILEDSVVWPGVKTGACGELAAYTYQKIRPLLGADYDVQFVRAAQSGFFLMPDATHIVLEIMPHKIPFGKKPIPYILDPSFKRYGLADEFEDYLFFEKNGDLPFVTQQQTDLTFPVKFNIPMWIHEDYLLSFVVEGANGKFDANNYGIALLATRRNRFMSRYVLALQKQEGATWTLENEPLMKQVLKETQYVRIRKKMHEIFDQINSSMSLDKIEK